jgi:toxin-antitoxin system PIN domain toxin
LIAIDTNLLVYAHRRDSTWHSTASEALRRLAQSSRPWAIPWPVLHEFLAIVTHSRIYDPPSTVEQACIQVDNWLESPSLVLLGEVADYWSVLRRHVSEGRVSGPRVHDAHIAALCAQHGVSELWSADRDFSRFPALPTRNPLVTED